MMKKMKMERGRDEAKTSGACVATPFTILVHFIMRMS